MRWLEHRIPPPIVFAVIACGMWGLSWTAPRITLEMGSRYALAAIIAAIALGLAIAAARQFPRAETTIDPVRIEAVSRLVTHGVFGLTRNPMYLGFALLLLAVAVLLASPAALIGPVLFVLYITRFQIGPEERMLEAKFGAAYTAYKFRVRRWL